MSLARLLNYRRKWGILPDYTWKSGGTISGLTLHDPRLGGTFTKIDAELLIDETSVTVDRAYLQVRQQNVPSSAFVVRDCAIVRVGAGEQSQYGAQSAIYGVVPYMTPGVTYEALMWVQVDGLLIRHYMGTVTMRTEDIVDFAITPPTPTKYVGTGGTDSGSSSGGTTPAAPWRTTEQAVTYMASGGVCRFGPGFYGPAQVDRTASGTFYAQYPSCDINGQAINQGLHSVIEPITVTAPTGTTAHTPGNADYSIGSSNPYTVAPWVAVALQGTGQTLPGGTFASPTTPEWHGGTSEETPDGTIWKLSNVPAIDAQALAQVGYCANRGDDVSKLGHTRNDTAVLDSPGGWAEILDTNLDYNDSGAFLFGTDLYIRLPSHARRADGQLSRNPNDYWMKVGGDDIGFDIDGNNIRLDGFNIQCQQFAVQVHNPRSFNTFTRNTVSCFGGGFRMGHGSVSTNGAQGFTGYSNNNVMQENRMIELNFWREDDDGIPWRVCKDIVTLANGLVYNSTNGYTGAIIRWTQMENTGFTARGGGVRNVIRNNFSDGPFNGLTFTGFSTSEGRYSGYACEAYGNTFKHLVDDTWELDQNICNAAIWGERVEQALVGLSLGPCDFGPIYLWECALYLGRDGIAKRLRDATIADSSLSCTLVKHSGGSLPRAKCFISNITLVGDEIGVWGPGELAAPTGSNEEEMDILNCIYVITGRCIFRASTQPYTVDYSVMVTNNAAGGSSYGISWNGTNYTDDIPAFRTASGQFAHGNIVDGQEVSGWAYTEMLAHLRDPFNFDARDFRLKSASYSKFVGVNIPGWTRQGGTVYMGYQPYGDV